MKWILYNSYVDTVRVLPGLRPLVSATIQFCPPIGYGTTLSITIYYPNYSFIAIGRIASDC